MTFPRPQSKEVIELIPVWHGGMHKEWWPEPPRMPVKPPSVPARAIKRSRAEELVLAAIPGQLSDVLRRTGLTYDQVQPVLTSLVKAGAVEKQGWRPVRYRKVEERSFIGGTQMSKVKSTEDRNVIAHTPIPWYVAPDSGTTVCGDDDGSVRTLVADTDARGKTDTQARADARLIAAAPDLLAALKRLSHIAVWDEDFDADDRAEFDAAMTDAHAAIVKAERR